MRRFLVTIGFVTAAGAALAQHQHGSHGASQARPYAGLDRRAVASLTDEQVADLRAGRGMGLALSAELNGYPGPIHVIELAAPLGLTDAQRSRVEALHAAMKAEAVPLGERLIAQEADLDAAFRQRTVTAATLAEKTDAIAATQGLLRRTHLKYHLDTVQILTPDQTARYQALRGYQAR
jgi:Spy/CpxP family protein refolding chaperone